MTKYLTIKDRLYLTQTEVVPTEQVTEEASGATNHIWIYDRSGSMYYVISQLIEDLIARAKQIPGGDTLTLGWFSSEGKFNFILKGFKIASDSDYRILESVIRKNNYTIGLTCFSEILQATESVVEDLAIITDRFALCFFTDGYPVVSDYQKETDNIFKAIKKIEGKITASLLIGYGNYYNKPLMAQMAGALGGSLTHSEDLPKFNVALENFVQNVQSTEAKVSVKIPQTTEGDIFFSTNKAGVNVYAVDNNCINYPRAKGKGKNYLYCLTARKPDAQWKQLKFTDANVKNGKQESMIKGAYAAAYILTQKTQTDVALEILGVLGDKALIDVTNNAFTNEEFGTVERRINEAITSAKKRFINGRDPKYLPKENSFCVLDALDLLMQDENASFYPTEPSFVYKRIGVPSVTKEGYPAFTADANVSCPFSSITWNETKLNLSVLVKIPGFIKLKRDYKKHGFTSNKFPTWIYRNYALVKDGFLNVPVLPMSMTWDSFKILKDAGLIEDTKVWSNIAVFSVHLDRIPIMNRAIAKGKTSATELFKKTFEAFKIKAHIKALKYLQEQKQPKQKISTTAFTGLTETQVEFLGKNGITDNGFNPPKERLEATDYYFAKEFTVKMAKLSSLPKVSDVIAKVEASKKLTLKEELIQEGLVLTTNDIPGKIKSLQRDLTTITSGIQRAKFAIVLGKKWFDEFESREDNTMTLDNITYSIGLKEKRVEI